MSCPSVVVHLVSEIFSCNVLWPFSLSAARQRSYSGRKNWAVLSLPKEPRVSFYHPFESYHFLDFIAENHHWFAGMLDLRVFPLTGLLTVFSIFCISLSLLAKRYTLWTWGTAPSIALLVLAAPIERGVKARWFMRLERKCSVGLLHN